jgi:hypothetical protein
MNVPDDLASLLSTIPGTYIHSFPQTYLDLPLSPLKLRVSAFQALLNRIDTYLAGWREALLTKGGRLSTTAAVLDNLPTCFMAALLLPILILQKIDKKRRAFFWAGDNQCSGA